MTGIPGYFIHGIVELSIEWKYLKNETKVLIIDISVYVNLEGNADKNVSEL